MSYLLKLYEANDQRKLFSQKHAIKTKRLHPLLEDESWKMEMIEEMCLVKMGFIEGEDEEKDIKTFLEIICTE